MWSTLQSIGGFVNRNRTKIAVATVIAVGVTLYLTYNSEPEQVEEVATQEFRPLQLGDESKAKKTANRTRLLFKARRQFDTSASQFLPTLRTKIVEVIDINGTVKHIKELRARATNNKDELEARLWAEIKDASFALLVVTAYMLSAVCTLLRIQLHILARTMHQSYVAEGEDGDFQLNGEMFRMLIEGTYKHLFGAGLKSFAERVKSQVRESLADWTVKDKLHVDYEELVQALGAVRHALEADMNELIRTIFIPPEAIASTTAPTNGAAGVASTSGPTVARAGHAATVQNLLDQTWDLLETPAFRSVYAEALDCAFRHIHGDLYRTVFHPESRSPGQHTLRSPPLASILPQIKTIAMRMLPSGVANNSNGSSSSNSVSVGALTSAVVDEGVALSPEIRDIASGQYLDAFCIAVFDTPLR